MNENKSTIYPDYHTQQKQYPYIFVCIKRKFCNPEKKLNSSSEAGMKKKKKKKTYSHRKEKEKNNKVSYDNKIV